MAADDGRDARRRSRRRWVLVTGVLAFAAWHAIFDVTLDRAMKAYVAGQERHVRGEGPARRMRDEMADARQRGAVLGLAGAGGILIVSWTAARLLTRRVSG
jgi:hypothetical protein